jgi:hypothetical protein
MMKALLKVLESPDLTEDQYRQAVNTHFDNIAKVYEIIATSMSEI